MNEKAVWLWSIDIFYTGLQHSRAFGLQADAAGRDMERKRTSFGGRAREDTSKNRRKSRATTQSRQNTKRTSFVDMGYTK